MSTALPDALTWLRAGTGIEIEPQASLASLKYSVSKWFPGYLVFSKRGHTLVFRPIGVPRPAAAKAARADLPAARRYQPASATLSHLKDLIAQGVESQADAARALGLTRERVRQLVNRHDLNLKRRSVRSDQICHECGTKVHRRNTTIKSLKYPHLCRACAARQRGRKPPVVLVCRLCGAERTYPVYNAKLLKTEYCSRCWGKRIPPALPRPPVDRRIILRCTVCGKERKYRPIDASRLRTDKCLDCFRKYGV